MFVALVKEASQTVEEEGPSLAFFVRLATSLALLSRCGIGSFWILEKVGHVRVEDTLLQAETVSGEYF